VHGPVRDVLAFARQILTTELGAVVDNPVIVPDGEVMTTGNFRGEPLAFAATCSPWPWPNWLRRVSGG
jgi:histidine ammonia-lyase